MSQDSSNCEISEEKKSLEIPNSGGARKSKLATSSDTILFAYENLKTTWDAVEFGLKKSGNGKCFGWRSSNSSYSWITYDEFIKRAQNFGSGLRKIGLNPGQSSKVGIYAQNSVEWVVAQYGIWSQSAVLIPLYDTLGLGASIFMINQADIEIVICDKEQKVRHIIAEESKTPLLKHVIMTTAASQALKNMAKENGVSLHSFKEIENLGEKYPVPLLLPNSCDVCLLCYTSGTTGDPKGVLLTHENLLSVCCTLNLFLGKLAVTKEDSTLSYLPLAHIFQQFVHILFLMVGARIGFFSGNVGQLLDDMEILQPTILPAVPRLLNKWFDQAQTMTISKLKRDLCNEDDILEKETQACKSLLGRLGNKLRLIMTGAAPIGNNVVEFYTKIVGCKVLEIYGQTECCGPCCGIILDSSYDGCAGVPFPSYLMKLVDVPEMGYLSKNSEGEVCIKGLCVFKGYFKDPTKTEEALDKDGWLHTGDVGIWLPNGNLKIIDRKKNILKVSQGVYVSPEKIENIYATSAFITQIYVQGDSLKSVLVAIVIPDKETVVPWCRENLKSDSWLDICKNAALKKVIFEDMLQKGKEAGLKSFEQVKAISLYPEVLTFEAGFLTPTSKLKREFCRKYFKKDIELLYNTC